MHVSPVYHIMWPNTIQKNTTPKKILFKIFLTNLNLEIHIDTEFFSYLYNYQTDI